MNIIEKLLFKFRHWKMQRELNKIATPVLGPPYYIIKYKDGRPDETTNNCAECLGLMYHKINCSFNKK